MSTTHKSDIGAEIKGLEAQKRAAMIAAAGQHSIAFVGPSGSGKSRLRQFCKALGLPESMTFECITLDDLEALWATERIEICIEVTPASRREMETRLIGTTTADAWVAVKNARLSRGCQQLSESAQSVLDQLKSDLSLSSSTERMVAEVCRTIASVDGGQQIGTGHVIKAMNYCLPPSSTKRKEPTQKQPATD